MQISNIDASLSYGKVLSRMPLAIIYIGIINALLFPLITIILLITRVEWDMQSIIVFILGNIIFMCCFIFFCFLKLKNDKLKKKINLWFEDAIEASAYSKKIGESRYWLQAKATKIQVKFKIADKTYVRESSVKAIGGQKGYTGTFNKYADKEINILYSPKYDEVLILKDKKN